MPGFEPGEGTIERYAGGDIRLKFVQPARNFVAEPFFSRFLEILQHAQAGTNDFACIIVTAGFKLPADEPLIMLVQCYAGHRSISFETSIPCNIYCH